MLSIFYPGLEIKLKHTWPCSKFAYAYKKKRVCWFLPIKQVMTSDQRFMGLLSIFYVFKNMNVPILLLSFLPVQFLEQFFFFPFFQLCIHKPYPQSKTFYNIGAFPNSAVFLTMLCLKQPPVLVCISSVSLMCCQVSLLPLEWP